MTAGHEVLVLEVLQHVVIEFDVLRPESDFADGSEWRTAPAGPARGTGPLVIANGSLQTPGVVLVGRSLLHSVPLTVNRTWVSGGGGVPCGVSTRRTL